MGQTSSTYQQPPAVSSARCPIPAATSSKCPISHDSPPKQAQCPIDHTALNPLNQMPTLPQTPAPEQSIILPTERTESSIPRDSSAKWEYPSPQQFYNALVRKGWETPEEHVETMVDIHNFLNEQAWDEVRKWEGRESSWVFIFPKLHARFLSLPLQ
jgi:cytochrome c heme-lyase